MVKHILVFTRYFAPVYEASGPIQSIFGMANALSDRYRFSVVSSAYDPRKPKTYGEVQADTWQEYQGIRIYYASHGKRGWSDMKARIAETQPDLLYSQSFFDPIFSGLPLALVRLGAVSKIPRLIAPRGELNAGALAISSGRKKCYMALMKYGLLGDGAHIHTTSDVEKQSAIDLLGVGAQQVHVANNIKALASCTKAPPSKQKGAARFAYLGRIAPIKNLHLALQYLAQQHGDVDFDIYGPLDNDTAYWERCQAMIAQLPPHVRVHYHGSVDPENVTDALRKAHFFLLPTAGENFGHAILEALNAGLPAIIGDQTPHLHEDAQAGWALPLADEAGWLSAIETCMEMDQESYSARVQAAQQYAKNYHASSTAVEDHIAMFDYVMGA